jgi:hypothetical protein
VCVCVFVCVSLWLLVFALRGGVCVCHYVFERRSACGTIVFLLVTFEHLTKGMLLLLKPFVHLDRKRCCVFC